ncbi:uncharacterized protein LOC120835655 isoform X1 [Gasterosteus aculeatus]
MEEKWEEVHKYLSEGLYPSGYGKSQKLNLRRYSEKFTLKNGELFIGERRAIKLKADAKKIFVEFHDSPMGGHSGIIKTRHAISSRFYWKGMSIDIDAWVLECDMCQRLGTPLASSEPLQCIKLSTITVPSENKCDAVLREQQKAMEIANLKAAGNIENSQERQRQAYAKRVKVEAALEDGDSDTFTMLNEAGVNSTIDGIPCGVQGRPVEGIRHEAASDDRPVKRKRNKRSLIWRHYEELDGLAAARCCICMKLQSFEGGSTSNLHRHMSKRHPEVFSQLAADRRPPPPTHSSAISDANVEVVLEDGDSDTPNSTMNGIRECTQGDPAEQMRHKEASDDQPVKRRRSKRSLIWRHYEHLDSLAAVRCRICMKKLQYFEGGSTSNLHRHMSKRHPEMFSQLLADGQPPPSPHSSHSSGVDGDTFVPQNNAGATEKPRLFSGVLKVSKASVGEKRVLRRERELIEALRAAQREEARALEHQRELLEKLRAVNAREAAAEREQIESLRTAQLEEAKDLSRQREEVEKEKSELLTMLEELQRQ